MIFDLLSFTGSIDLYMKTMLEEFYRFFTKQPLQNEIAFERISTVTDESLVYNKAYLLLSQVFAASTVFRLDLAQNCRKFLSVFLANAHTCRWNETARTCQAVVGLP